MFKRGMIKENASLLRGILKTADLLLFILSAYIAYIIRFWDRKFDSTYIELLFLMLFIIYLVFSNSNIYQSWRGSSIVSECTKLIYLSWLSFLLLFAIFFELKIGSVFSRNWMTLCFVIFCVLICISRVILRYFLKTFRSRGWNRRSVCLISAGNRAQVIYEHISLHPETGYAIKNIFSDQKSINGIPDGLITGGIQQFKEWIEQNHPDQVWIDAPMRRFILIEKVISYAKDSASDIVYIPDLQANRFINSSISEIANMVTVNLYLSPITSGINLVVKRIEDILATILLMPILIPIILIAIVAVKISSPGPVFFKQKRHGFKNDIFYVYKFRSMKIHKEAENLVTQAKKNDSRITSIGKILRRTSIDELPQFFNVLKGDMSIVGPRPHAVEHNELYKTQIDYYMKRHKVKPGITGWAQVNGLRGETNTTEKMAERIKFDIYYIRNWSLWFDLKIIMLTPFKGLINKGY